MNGAVMNTDMQTSALFPVYNILGLYVTVEILDHIVILYLE
jgi:hypothetical protein